MGAPDVVGKAVPRHREQRSSGLAGLELVWGCWASTRPLSGMQVGKQGPSVCGGGAGELGAGGF